jgi:phosphatidylglycerol:prolipoprotein diacylglycerol transferase
VKPILWRFHAGDLGLVSFPAYFTLLTIGFCFTIYLARRDGERLGLDPIKLVDIHLYMILFGIIGSRLLHVLADGHLMDYVYLCVDSTKVIPPDAPVAQCTTDLQCGPHYQCARALGHCYPPPDCWAWAKFWRGGLTYYGGFIAATSFAIWYINKNKMPFWRVADVAARQIPLGLVWGRLGCFFNGCCFGSPVEGMLGMKFPRGSAVWQAQVDAHMIGRLDQPIPVHATQLYESVVCFAIYCYLTFYQRSRTRHDGQAFWTFVMLYSLGRFAIEVLRRDDRGGILFLSTSQLISIPLFVLGLFMVRVMRRRAAPVALPPI